MGVGREEWMGVGREDGWGGKGGWMGVGREDGWGTMVRVSIRHHPI